MMIDYDFKYEYSNIAGYANCCDAMLIYPFKHKDWCPFGDSDTKQKKIEDIPINVKRPYLEGDLIQDFHTGKKYRMKDGEWVEI